MFTVNVLKCTLKDENVKKCIRMEITVLKLSFGEVNLCFYGYKSHFRALLLSHCGTKFGT